MAHPLVLQLRFARSEFLRALVGVTEADAARRLAPMNCISWNVGHLAWQEQRYWLDRGQGRILLPEISAQFAYGAPATTPSLAAALDSWRAITAAADPWLDTLTTEFFAEQRVFHVGDDEFRTSFGSLMLRMLYHYWYHTGENMAIRQMLGHQDLPDFVGDIDEEAPYQPDASGGAAA